MNMFTKKSDEYTMDTGIKKYHPLFMYEDCPLWKVVDSVYTFVGHDADAETEREVNPRAVAWVIDTMITKMYLEVRGADGPLRPCLALASRRALLTPRRALPSRRAARSALSSRRAARPARSSRRAARFRRRRRTRATSWRGARCTIHPT